MCITFLFFFRAKREGRNTQYILIRFFFSIWLTGAPINKNTRCVALNYAICQAIFDVICIENRYYNAVLVTVTKGTTT